MDIKRFKRGDEEEASALVIKTLREVSIKDYSKEYIEDLIQRMQPGNIAQRAANTHFYCLWNDDKIIGCGAIGPYWDKKDESCLFTFFVLPEYEGKGAGRKIMEALEKDEYVLGAKSIEVPASITAVPFYLKMGYGFKNGIKDPDGEGLVRMEKIK